MQGLAQHGTAALAWKEQHQNKKQAHASGNNTGTAQLFATLFNKPQDLTAAQFVVI